MKKTNKEIDCNKAKLAVRAMHSIDKERASRLETWDLVRFEVIDWVSSEKPKAKQNWQFIDSTR